MCGRFTQTKTVEEVAQEFEAFSNLNKTKTGPRYNVAPEQDILTVGVGEKGRRELSLMSWGLIPHWSKDGHRFINARAETLIEKPSFRESFKKRRCLIPATGFYEWSEQGRTKRPYYFHLKNKDLFAFAGIWDEWKTGTGTVRTCAIITTSPNELLEQVHDRMPVILHPSSYEDWLGNKTPVDQLIEWLLPYPDEYMTSYAVSKNVNSPSFDDPSLIKPVMENNAGVLTATS